MYRMCYERGCRNYGQYVSADHAKMWHGTHLRVPNEDDFDEHGELRAYR
jgi:hypothetical protein